MKPTKKSAYITLSALLLFFSCSLNEGGVRAANNMEKYALDYIKKNQLVEESEKILAYYDYTISLDGTEAAILTSSRLIYHNSETLTSSVNLEDIRDVQHRKETLIGDIIEVTTADGEVWVIEIAPLNQGETFLKILKSKVNYRSKMKPYEKKNTEEYLF